MVNQIAQRLRQKGFSIVCCNAEKQPIGKNGFRLSDWNKKTFSELEDENMYHWDSFCIRMGQHQNKRTIICLDFDIYCEGGNHEAVKTFLDEWKEDSASEGLYSTSTEGNYAVLLDITDSDVMMKEIEELKLYNQHKIKAFGELEILYGSGVCKVLPNSKTMCKKSKTIRQSKLVIEDSKPILKIDDTCECLIELFTKATNDFRKHSKKTAKTDFKQEITIQIGEYPYVDKWIDLLMNYMGNPQKNGSYLIDRNGVLKIATALKINNYDLSFFYDWLMIDPTNQYGNACENIWDTIKDDSKMNMSVLCNICKEIDMNDALQEWSNKYREWLSLELLGKGDVSVAKYLNKIMNLKYYNKRWIYYNSLKCLWIETEDVAHLIAEKIQYLINIATRELNNKLIAIPIEDTEARKIIEEQLQTYYRHYASANKSHRNLITLMKGFCAVDEAWVARLDNIPYKIAFEDGIFDLKKGYFRKGLYATDYLTRTIPMKYQRANPTKKAKLLTEIKKICNWNDTHTDRYLSQLGYMMCGDASREQLFFNYKGETASNGKSVVPEALSVIMPCYCRAMGSDTFEVSNKAQVHKTIATWRGLRIGWVNETDKNAQQDAGLLKKIADGTPLTYKKMYANQEEMPITFKLIFIGNQELRLKDADGGIQRRMTINQLDSDFSATQTEDDYNNCVFVKDLEFQKKLYTEYQYELLDIIFDYSKLYSVEGRMKPVPIEWENEKAEVLDGNRPVEEFIRNTFTWKKGQEHHKDWWITKSDIDLLLKQHKIDQNAFRTELKRMRLYNNPIIYDRTKKWNKMVGVYFNIRLLSQIDEECE
jgi:hypothetical protein